MPTFKTVRAVVVMDDGKGEIPDDPRILRYEDLMANASEVDFNVRDERQAASMCYTSGTTGVCMYVYVCACCALRCPNWLSSVRQTIDPFAPRLEQDIQRALCTPIVRCTFTPAR